MVVAIIGLVGLLITGIFNYAIAHSTRKETRNIQHEVTTDNGATLGETVTQLKTRVDRAAILSTEAAGKAELAVDRAEISADKSTQAAQLISKHVTDRRMHTEKHVGDRRKSDRKETKP